MASTTVQSLTSQASDILGSILYHLRVADLLSLRLCCRRLNEVTHERHIWVSALHNVIRALELCPATFPISTMTTLQLERAATAHIRFRRNIESSQDREAVVYSDRTMARNGPLDCIRIIRGGRFLLILRARILELWDTVPGVPQDGLVSSVQCRDEHSPFIYVWLSVYAGQPDDIKISVRESPIDYSWTKVTLFSIDPAAQKPVFHHTGTIFREGDFHFWTGVTSHFTFADIRENRLGTYNVETKETFTWPVDGGTHAVARCPSSLVRFFVDQCGAEIFPDPAPRDRTNSALATVAWLEEMDSQGRCESWRIPYWTLSCFSGGFDVLGRRIKDGKFTIVHKYLMPMDRLETGIDQPTRHAPKTTHCGVYELEGLDIDNIYPRSLTMPDGWRAIYWYEDDVDLRIHFSDISTPSSPSTSVFR
ncbi:hypothetical protein DL96DRAFT_235421 [Flagelloscypha sp. PMI_526]|nr:hypothetical protein DL96DRAFT_235421 [Flagelloscypha sp. PMI_526]